MTRIVFQAGKDGKSEQLLWKQGGDEEVAPRVVLVKPTPAELNEYAASYFNEELDVRFQVEADGNGLVLRSVPGDVRLAPETRDRFTSRMSAMPAITFQRDVQARITGFVIGSDAVGDLLFIRNGPPSPTLPR